MLIRGIGLIFSTAVDSARVCWMKMSTGASGRARGDGRLSRAVGVAVLMVVMMMIAVVVSRMLAAVLAAVAAGRVAAVVVMALAIFSLFAVMMMLACASRGLALLLWLEGFV